MPLILLTGYPCSGLSYRARQLAGLLESAQDNLLAQDDNATTDQKTLRLKSRYKVVVVPSHDASHPRTVYDNARTEKEARGVAYARIKRALTRDTIVIADGMNYIKGWRYQLWCEAKAVGTTCCVVHVGTPPDKCTAINDSRRRRREQKISSNCITEDKERSVESTQDIPETPSEKNETQTEQNVSSSSNATDDEDPYPPDLLQNLIFRYEEPSIHSRWDKPLFTVPWSDEKPPVDDIFTALTGISPNPLPSADSTTTGESLAALLTSTTLSSPSANPAGTASVAPSTFTRTTARTLNPTRTSSDGRPQIKQHQATVQPNQTDASALYSFEKTTNSIITSIRTFTTNNPSAEAALATQQNQELSPSQTRGSSTSYRNGIVIPVNSLDASISVFIPEHVALSATTDELAGAGGILALPRLQRLRRQWIGMNRAFVGHNPGGKRVNLRPEQVGDAFVRFLNKEFGGGDDDDYELDREED